MLLLLLLGNGELELEAGVSNAVTCSGIPGGESFCSDESSSISKRRASVASSTSEMSELEDSRSYSSIVASLGFFATQNKGTEKKTHSQQN